MGKISGKSRTMQYFKKSIDNLVFENNKKGAALEKAKRPKKKKKKKERKRNYSESENERMKGSFFDESFL